jgi:hypothetical protein
VAKFGNLANWFVLARRYDAIDHVRVLVYPMAALAQKREMRGQAIVVADAVGDLLRADPPLFVFRSSSP